MARYTGPRAKRARRLGVAMEHLTGKSADKDPALRKPYPPGQHGPTGRIKVTDYGSRLAEKQKLKLAYEVLESQFRKYVEAAKRSGSNAASMLVIILESRFDCIVWRAGFATSVRQARQMVRHGYFLVNGKKANIPSMRLGAGAKIELVEKFKAHPLLADCRERSKGRITPWNLKVSADGHSVEVTGAATDVLPPIPVDIRKVIELYA